jgi:hypothetical protein
MSQTRDLGHPSVVLPKDCGLVGLGHPSDSRCPVDLLEVEDRLEEDTAIAGGRGAEEAAVGQ